MKIAIDALGISQPGGGRSATLNLLEPLIRIDGKNEYIIFVDAPEHSLLGAPNVVQMVAPTMHRMGARLWAQATWPVTLRRARVDIVHHTKNLTTFMTPGLKVVTVHDLTILVYPEIYPRTDVAYWRTLERVSLRRADAIIAVSQRTAEDIMTYYEIPAERIHVIYEGIDEHLAPGTTDEIERVCTKYGLRQGYILHVGSISEKKNLRTLVKAYARLVRTGIFTGDLVLVGRSYWPGGIEALKTFIAQEVQGGRVVLTGSIPASDLAPIYSGARCLCFPSLHEGFGLVPLEAMACGTPVVASKVGALEEMAGEAIVFVKDALSDGELAERLAAIIQDDALWRGLREAGLAKAPLFSRQRAARETLELYRTLGS